MLIIISKKNHKSKKTLKNHSQKKKKLKLFKNYFTSNNSEQNGLIKLILYV